jgi:glycosyltransferase involved in cell wall biosynthesis
MEKMICLDGSFLDRMPGGIARDSIDFIGVFKNANINVTIAEFRKQNLGLIPSLEVPFTRRTVNIIAMVKRKSVTIDVNYQTTLNMHLSGHRIEGMSQTFTRLHDFFPLTYPNFFTKRSKYLYLSGLSAFKKSKDIGITNSIATLNESRRLGITNEIFTLYCSGGVKVTSPCGCCSYCSDQINPDNSFYVSVGTIEPRKNYHQLAEKWTSQKIQENLLIVGNPGWLKGHVKKLSELSSLNNKISILNHICDFGTYALIKKSNGLISASRDEGFNIPLREARLLGTRIFSTKVSVNEEFHGSISKWIRHDLDDLSESLRHAKEEPFDSKLNLQKLNEFDEIRNSQIKTFLERTFAD